MEVFPTHPLLREQGTSFPKSCCGQVLRPAPSPTTSVLNGSRSPGTPCSSSSHHRGPRLQASCLAFNFFLVSVTWGFLPYFKLDLNSLFLFCFIQNCPVWCCRAAVIHMSSFCELPDPKGVIIFIPGPSCWTVDSLKIETVPTLFLVPCSVPDTNTI